MGSVYEKLVFTKLSLPYYPSDKREMSFSITHPFFLQDNALHIGTIKAKNTPSIFRPLTDLRYEKISHLLKEEREYFNYEEINLIEHHHFLEYEQYERLFNFESFVNITSNSNLKKTFPAHTLPYYLVNKSIEEIIHTASMRAKTDAPSATEKHYEMTDMQKDSRRTQYIKEQVKKAEEEHTSNLRSSFNEFCFNYDKSIPSYMKFLEEVFTQHEINNFLERDLHTFLHEKDFQKHIYLTGASGSGKTELIKALIHQHIRQNSSSLVLIDPHGDIAKDVLHFQENSINNNVIYLDPFLDDELSPCVNPFELKDKSDKSIAYTSQEIVKTILEILNVESGFSVNMKSLLEPCISILLKMPNSTLKDLQRFMDDENNQDLVSFGQSSDNPVFRDFFKTGFYNKNLTSTKQSLYAKIQSLLNSYAFYNLTSRKNSFDLKEALNSKKIILLNLSKGVLGDEASIAFGRFFISKILSIVKQRAEEDEYKRMPIYLYIDEAQNYISSSIEEVLTEARKFKLYMCLAQQVFGQNMSIQLKEIVLSNTNIKLVGKNSGKSAKVLGEELGVEAENIHSLETGEFYCKRGHHNSFRFRSHDKLLNRSNSMDDEEMEKFLLEQKRNYYSVIKQKTKTSKNQDKKENNEENSFQGKFGL